MVGGSCNRRLKAFEQIVAFHQHKAIQSDLYDLMCDKPCVPVPVVRQMTPSTSNDSSVAPPDAFESPFQSPPMSVSSLESLTFSLGNYHSIPDCEFLAPSGSNSRFCKVQFKCLFRNYVLPEYLSHVQVGEFLIVQSLLDNLHEDLGVVIALYTQEEFMKMNSILGPSEDVDENKVGLALRIATEDDRRFLPLKHEREAPLLKACQTFVDRFCLEMTVYGVEYQFDGNVLFIYYVSKGRVDFRSLVQHIVRIYCRKTRIQMKKTNQCREFIPQQFAYESLATGQYYAPPAPRPAASVAAAMEWEEEYLC